MVINELTILSGDILGLSAEHMKKRQLVGAVTGLIS